MTERMEAKREKCASCAAGKITVIGGFPVHICEYAVEDFMHLGYCPCCGKLPNRTATGEADDG